MCLKNRWSYIIVMLLNKNILYIPKYFVYAQKKKKIYHKENKVYPLKKRMKFFQSI